jgi:hypothetical protein
MAVADVHTDTLEYGLNGGNMTNSTFAGIFIPAPALNISAAPLVYLHSDGYEYDSFFSEETDDSSLLLWGYDNQTYNRDDLQQKGSCQAQLVRESLAKPSFPD